MPYEDLVETATQAAKQKNHEEARKIYGQLLDMRPNCAPLLAAYAGVCVNLGDKRAAMESLERSLELDRSKPGLGFLYVKLASDLDAPVRRELVPKAGARWLMKLLPGPLRSLADGRDGAVMEDWGIPVDLLGKAKAAEVRRARDLVIRGRLEEAKAIADSLPKSGPGHAAALEIHGRVKSQAFQYDEAATQFEEALAIVPDEPAVHADLLLAWVRAGRLGSVEAALSALPPAIREGAEVRLVEAHMLERSGLPQEALDLLDEVTERPDIAAFYLSLRASVLSGLGRFDELQSAVEKLARLRPEVGDAFALAGMYNRIAPSTELFSMAEALAENPNVQQEQRARAAFAIGAGLRSAGDHESSLRWIEKGNRLVDRIYDRAAEEDFVETQKRIFTPALVGRSTDVERGRGLVFIVGLPRSGSTLTSLILGRHPEAVSIGEHAGGFLCIAQARNDGYPEKTADFTESYLESLAETYLYELPSIARGARYVIDKELGKFAHLGLMRMIFPGARFVHTRRNPMDVCFSIYSRLFVGPFAYACRQETLAHYHRMHDALMAHWAQVLQDKLYECRYEELVADPETQIPRLLEGAGMTFDEACLHPEEADFVHQTSSIHQVRQGIYKSSVGGWKRHSDHLQTLARLLDQQ